MTYVITEPCKGVLDLGCIDVCPVDCIHGPFDPTGKGQEVKNLESYEGLMLYIDPDECIDCAACVYVCPVKAIFADYEVPEKWKDYIQLNADFFKD